MQEIKVHSMNINNPIRVKPPLGLGISSPKLLYVTFQHRNLSFFFFFFYHLSLMKLFWEEGTSSQRLSDYGICPHFISCC